MIAAYYINQHFALVHRFFAIPYARATHITQSYRRDAYHIPFIRLLQYYVSLRFIRNLSRTTFYKCLYFLFFFNFTDLSSNRAHRLWRICILYTKKQIQSYVLQIFSILYITLHTSNSALDVVTEIIRSHQFPCYVYRLHLLAVFLLV